MSFMRVAVKRSRIFVFTLVLLTVSGLMTYLRMSKESFPDVTVPMIFTTVNYVGISPEDGERLIAKPLEKEFKTLSGLKQIDSKCYEGYCRVKLDFIAGYDIDKGLRETKDAVDNAKANMPSGIEEPIIKEINTSEFAIAIVNIYGTAPEKTLMNIADELQDVFESIPGVLEAEVGGERDERVEILIDPAKLNAYKLSVSDLGQFFAGSNMLIPAGNIETSRGAFPVKVPGLIENVEDVLNLPIKVSNDAVIKLSDVAEIRRTFADATQYVRMNNQPSFSIEIKKRSGANTINTVAMVKRALEEAKGTLPSNVIVKLTNNSADRIKDNLVDLQNNVISSMFLVIVCVVLMLGIRTGLLVGFSIPVSFFIGILLLGFMGVTINMVVLFGLILAVGMLVDGAIVVTEYADKRMQEGVDKIDAYAEASGRMALSIIASTVTTLIAFAPLLLWPGIIGEFIKYLPLTVICVLSASLVVALVFIPVLGAMFGKAGVVSEQSKEALIATETGHYENLTGYMKVYYNILHWALLRPWKIIVGIILALFVSFFIYAKFGVGVEFFPDSEPDFLKVNVHARGNLSIDEKTEFIRQVETRLSKMKYFKNIYSRTGAKSYNSAEDVIGYVQVELLDWQTRPRAVKIIKEMEDKLSDVSGVILEVAKEDKGPKSGKPIEIEISANSDNQKLLENGFAYMDKAMDAIGGFANTENTLPLPGIQWEMRINKAQAAKFGVSIASIGSIVQMMTRGANVSTYRPDDSDDELDIVVRFPKKFRALDMIDNLYVVTALGKSVPISTFVDIVPSHKVNLVQRIDGRRVLRILTNVEVGYFAAERVAKLKEYIKKNPLPKGIRVKFRGEDEDSKESSSFIGFAFLAAVFMMGFVLLLQFNSFYSTFMILFSILLSTIGVVLGLTITRDPFSIVMTGLAIVSLAGVVVNNNIVLIDAYDEIKDKVSDPFDAIVRTGLQRLRPVYLTTVTTILGLVPMAMKLNIDFINAKVTFGAPSMDMWSAFSKSMIFGLGFATILTLIVTPCMLLVGVRMRSRIRNWWKQKFRKSEEF